MGVAVTGHQRIVDMRDFWVKRLKSGAVPEPEHAYVPAEEQYLTGSVSTDQRYNSKNCWRELFGRHRCIACGKPFWSQESAFNCHPEATACIVWRKFAHRGPAGATSLSDLLRAEISNPYGSFGNYGGPF